MKVNWEQIKKEYIDSNGEAVLKNLADAHGVKIGTLRSRKSREDWDGEISNGNATQRNKDKNVATQKRTTKTKKKEVKTENEKIVEEIIENKELTDEQQLFCIYYIKCFNATRAYQKAYGCDYVSAMSNSSRLIRNDKVRSQIDSLKQGKLNRAMLTEDDIFQKYIDIAFSDVTDYIDHGTEDIPLIDKSTNEQAIDENGNLVFYERNYINFKEGTDIDGSLVSEISQGKDGVKVKLQDKMKALQWLTDHMDLLTTHNKEKLQLEKDKLEHVRGKDNQTDESIEIVVTRKDKR